MPTVLVLLAWAGLLAALSLVGRRWLIRQRSLERMLEQDEREAPPAPAGEAEGLLRRWLFLAGFRAPGAPLTFLCLAALAAGAGLTLVFLAYRSGLLARAARGLALVPGGVGDIF